MNPIIFLWAHPRSMSTAIERVMRERGDFDCRHHSFKHFYRVGRCLSFYLRRCEISQSAARRDATTR